MSGVVPTPSGSTSVESDAVDLKNRLGHPGSMGRLDTPLTGRLLLGLLGYTALSSFLGLNGRFVLPGGGAMGALEFTYGVWRTSLLADVLFVAGSLFAGYLAWDLAKDERYAPSALVGFGVSWLTYSVSFIALGGPEWFSYHETFSLDTPLFVLAWGLVGLVFAAGAPGAVHAWTVRGDRPEREAERERARGVVLAPLDD